MATSRSHQLLKTHVIVRITINIKRILASDDWSDVLCICLDGTINRRLKDILVDLRDQSSPSSREIFHVPSAQTQRTVANYLWNSPTYSFKTIVTIGYDIEKGPLSDS